MRLGADATKPAPRSKGDPIAMRAAYSSGHVFGGRLDVPAIDHRQYMERELNMHNSHQSFASRERILQRMGDSGHQVIWFTDTIPNTPKASQSMDALAVMDQWLMNIHDNPGAGIVGNKPAGAVDACYDLAGKRMYAGADAWDGILDRRAAGSCTKAFPLYARRASSPARRSKAASTTAARSRSTPRFPTAPTRRGLPTRARSRS